MKIVLAKQNNSSNETKINNRAKKIIFLYYLVNWRFMILNTWEC